MRRSVQTTGGDLSGLMGGPVAWVCYGFIAVVLLWPLVSRLRRGRGDDDHPGGDDGDQPSPATEYAPVAKWEGPMS
jgi:putative tricarboxylic transport membrane protein